VKKPAASAIQCKQSEDLECTHESSDRGAHDALFELIQETEPALLLCRDALMAGGNHSCELKAINATLARITVLKSEILGSPAQAENVDFHPLFRAPVRRQKSRVSNTHAVPSTWKNRSSERARLAR